MVLSYNKTTNGLKLVIHSDNESLLSDLKLLVEKNKPVLDDKDGMIIHLQGKLKINLTDETLCITF